MITLVLAKPPTISILESSCSIKKCPTFWLMYDIKCLPLHRKELNSLSVLHLFKHPSFTDSLYHSHFKLLHALYEIYIPKIPNSPWARRGNVSQIHYSLNPKLRDPSLHKGHWNQSDKSRWLQGILCKSFLDSVP